MRHRLVDRVYRAAGVLALMYLPVLVWRVRDVGWHFQLQLHAVLVGLTFVLVLSLPRLTLPLKSALLVSLFVLLGLVGLFTMGMVGTGYWWCLQAAVMAATLYSIRAGVALAVLCALLLVVAGGGFVSGTIDLPFDMNQHVRNGSAWAAFLVVVLFAPLALLLALGSYQTTVERLVAQVNEQREQLERQVGHDSLTGLPLMRLAGDRLDVAIKHARRAGHKVAVLFVDLDGFKAVNDSLGHAAGDHVLQQVAQRLRRAVRDEDTVARVGGDEFVVVMGGIADPADAQRLAAVINAAVTRPIDWQGASARVSASVGISLFPDHADDAEALRRAADAAMYVVKNSGRNNYAFARDPCVAAKRA
jgi:diguanylate cyclase (GGDEF)-like protein